MAMAMTVVVAVLLVFADYDKSLEHFDLALQDQIYDLVLAVGGQAFADRIMPGHRRVDMTKEPIMIHGSHFMLAALGMQHNGIVVTTETPLPPLPCDVPLHASSSEWMAAEMGMDIPLRMHLKPEDVREFVLARGDPEAIKKVAQERHILITNSDVAAYVERFIASERAFQFLKAH